MEKYQKSYFGVFPGIWCHGDLVRKENPTAGGFIMLGRSDGVLNPGGQLFCTSITGLTQPTQCDIFATGTRIGAAERYGVLDCIACDQRRPGDADERVLPFLRMSNDLHLNDTLRPAVRSTIRTQLSARHVPSHILNLEVADIPCTLNGKRTEHVVSDVVNGRKPRALGSIANPECIKEFESTAQRLVGTSISPAGQLVDDGVLQPSISLKRRPDGHFYNPDGLHIDVAFKISPLENMARDNFREEFIAETESIGKPI
ncbi:hypothetical protein PspLS_00168 [Pyricularia sp. CBS 133598]|nr:hypothetical protein PspLS_00168 [Pyricularia sp. CBS 133598]